MRWSQDVYDLQSVLNKLNNAKLLIDGYRGVKTEAAIAAVLADTAEPTLPTESHFEDWEFKCHNGAVVPDELKSNLETLKAVVLEPIRAEQNAQYKTGEDDITLKIVSGYRTQGYNDNLPQNRSKPHPTTSMHILAAGADIKSDIGYHNLGVICKLLYDAGVIGGLGLGRKMIHVDPRHIIPYANRKALWFYDGFDNYDEWFYNTL